MYNYPSTGIRNALMMTPTGQQAIQRYAFGGQTAEGGPTDAPIADILAGTATFTRPTIYRDAKEKEISSSLGGPAAEVPWWLRKKKNIQEKDDVEPTEDPRPQWTPDPEHPFVDKRTGLSKEEYEMRGGNVYEPSVTPWGDFLGAAGNVASTAVNFSGLGSVLKGVLFAGNSIFNPDSFIQQGLSSLGEEKERVPATPSDQVTSPPSNLTINPAEMRDPWTTEGEYVFSGQEGKKEVPSPLALSIQPFLNLSQPLGDGTRTEILSATNRPEAEAQPAPVPIITEEQWAAPAPIITEEEWEKDRDAAKKGLVKSSPGVWVSPELKKIMDREKSVISEAAPTMKVPITAPVTPEKVLFRGSASAPVHQAEAIVSDLESSEIPKFSLMDGWGDMSSRKVAAILSQKHSSQLPANLRMEMADQLGTGYDGFINIFDNDMGPRERGKWLQAFLPPSLDISRPTTISTDTGGLQTIPITPSGGSAAGPTMFGDVSRVTSRGIEALEGPEAAGAGGDYSGYDVDMDQDFTSGEGWE